MIGESTTKTDPSAATSSVLDDEVVQLREWGSDRTYPLPGSSTGEWMIGSAQACSIRLAAEPRFVSRRHARLVRHRSTWMLTDNASKNGLWLDDARRPSFALVPGIEVGIGQFRLIVESPRLIALRAFLARLVGWAEEDRVDIDRALRALRDFATRRAPLILRGEGDLVAVARQLHLRMFGADSPFVVSDPRRTRSGPTSRSAENQSDALNAMHAAMRGTLCVWTTRLPSGIATVRNMIDRPGMRVRLIMCMHTEEDSRPSRCPAITLPPLTQRTGEIDRVIDEYAADAIAALGARPSSFTPADRVWIRRSRPQSLAEIETATLRLVAIREWGNVTRAAPHLGISHVALLRWLARRR